MKELLKHRNAIKTLRPSHGVERLISCARLRSLVTTDSFRSQTIHGKNAATTALARSQSIRPNDESLLGVAAATTACETNMSQIVTATDASANTRFVNLLGFIQSTPIPTLKQNIAANITEGAIKKQSQLILWSI